MALTKLCSALILLVLNASLLAQTTLFKLSDIDNYFVLNDAIYDVRNFSKVANAPISSKMPLHYLPKSQVLVSYDLSYGWLGNSLDIFDKTGKKISSNHYSECKPIISSSRTGLLFVKEKDLWYGTIKLSTGELINEKRLTTLGIFSGLGWVHWYDSKVLLPLEEGWFVINMDDGQMIPIPSLSSWDRVYGLSNISISPNRRYILPHLSKNGESQYYFDMLTLTKNYLNPSGVYLMDCIIAQNPSVLWIGSESAYIFSPGDDPERVVLSRFDVKSKKVSELVKYQSELCVVKESLDLSYSLGISNNISPDSSFIVLPKGIYGSNENQKVDLYALKHNRVINSDLSIDEDPDYHVKSLAFKWISGSKLIYRQKGTVVNQGTWVYDAEKSTNTKLVSFMADDIQVLPKSGYTIFVANNHVFRVKNDGTGLTQLTKEQLYQAKISEFYFTSNQ